MTWWFVAVHKYVDKSFIFYWWRWRRVDAMLCCAGKHNKLVIGVAGMQLCWGSVDYWCLCWLGCSNGKEGCEGKSEQKVRT